MREVRDGSLIAMEANQLAVASMVQRGGFATLIVRGFSSKIPMNGQAQVLRIDRYGSRKQPDIRCHKDFKRAAIEVQEAITKQRVQRKWCCITGVHFYTTLNNGMYIVNR